MFEQGKAAYRSHPPEAARSKAFDSENYPQAAHIGQQLRLPPYAKNLRPRAGQSLFVVIGRRGWSLFDRGGIDYGVLLPDPSPSLYRWPDLSGWADGLLIDRTDNGLSSDQTKGIAVALLRAGLPRLVSDRATFARRLSA